MKINRDIADEAVLQELGSRIARYRLNRNMTQSALANEAGVSPLTVHRIEHGHSTQALNLIRILRALDLLENLAALIPAPVASPIQQLRMQGKTRKRASSRSASSRSKESESDEPWSWGHEE